MTDNAPPTEAVYLYHGYFTCSSHPALTVYSLQSSADNFETTALSGLSEIPDLALDENCEIYVYHEEKAHPDTKERLKQMAENLKQGHTPDLEAYRDFAYIGLINEGMRESLRKFCENMTEALVLCRKPLIGTPTGPAHNQAP